MAGRYEHFELPVWSEPLPRRSQGGGRKRPKRGDRSAHGNALAQQVGAVAHLLQTRAQASTGINPKLVFRLRLDPKFGTLNDDQLSALGLRIVAREPGNLVVVFPDQDSLNELARRVGEYAGIVRDGHQYGELDAIEAILPLTPADRVGGGLRETPIAEGQVVPVDVELWHSGNKVECRTWITQLSALLEQHQSRISDDWIGEAICVVRAHLTTAGLAALLDETLDFIRDIDRPAKAAYEMLSVITAESADFPPIDGTLPPDSVGILVIDSGVMAGHPLLGAVLGDAQVFPDRRGKSGKLGPEDGDLRGGHGTAVAGLALYGDVGLCLTENQFVPQARLFSARVTGVGTEYDEDELLEHQLEDALTYFLDAYPEVRVVNLSLGNGDSVYRGGGRQFRFAAAIDELAFRYRDREVVFTVAAGNYNFHRSAGEAILGEYPDYLVNGDGFGLLDPATAALAITVGGLSYGPGHLPGDRSEERLSPLVAGERGFPSPFTRSGWGMDGAVKPDVVAFAGDLRIEAGGIGQMPQHAGVPTTNRDFAPPEARLFRTVSGTSYAAPTVAHLAARLFRDFPNASSNLIRALVAESAKVPENRPPVFAALKPSDDSILRVYGYGQPSHERARWSSENEVLLVADGTIGIDEFQLYELPPLPRAFFDVGGVGMISTTLAFDPPTRQTRADSYLGITMDAQLFRNLEASRVAVLMRQELEEERIARGENKRESLSTAKKKDDPPYKVKLQPGINRRKKGTLQRGTATIARANWAYDGNPLVLAVTCRREWAPESLSRQRYAVVVSFRHTNESIQLYSHIRNQSRVRVQPRLRVRV
jgi:hypothetical protein